jgi:hypothetical protein
MIMENCKICPAGFIEEARGGKPEYKDFRKMPHVACVKVKPSKQAEPVATKPPEPTSKSIVTLTDFGLDNSRKKRGIISAQGYFFIKNIETGKKESFRHYNVNTVIGTNEYGNLSNVTYEFTGGKKFSAGAGTNYQYPGKMPIKIAVTTGRPDGKGYAWFETDPGSTNLYCQPHHEINLYVADDGKKTVYNASCIAGNIRQIDFKEARERGLSVTGEFKEWLDMKGGDVPAETRDAILERVNKFNEKLDFKVN